jgi:hypothetical protein
VRAEIIAFANVGRCRPCVLSVPLRRYLGEGNVISHGR